MNKGERVEAAKNCIKPPVFTYDINLPSLCFIDAKKKLPYVDHQSIPSAGTFNYRVSNLELKAWFNCDNFCAITLTGFKSTTEFEFPQIPEGEFIDAHHIVPRSLARLRRQMNLNATIANVPILRAENSTINGIPLLRSLHNTLHLPSFTYWNIPNLTQQLAQQHFDRLYPNLKNIPFLPGVTLGNRWRQYLISKALIF